MGIITMKHDVEVQSTEAPSFLGRHRAKILALLFWSVVVSLYWWVTEHYNLSPAMEVMFVQDLLTGRIVGSLLFIVLFTLQPLVFFPSFILGIAGGMLYGPVTGTLLVTLGANGAANVCYLVGRFFGWNIVDTQSDNDGFIRRTMHGARNNTFETILTLHLLFVPFDLVNYLAGFFRMDWLKFALATVIGSIPGILTFVLFGASLQGDLLSGEPELNFSMLALSGGMLVLGITLSQVVKWRQRKVAKIRG
ncbi:MAG: TVP38/TMEM64 family protein [Anaerolineae bacterium]|nr:TVP38/TMEM64 family protein [Anaerolineae bacterium]